MSSPSRHHGAAAKRVDELIHDAWQLRLKHPAQMLSKAESAELRARELNYTKGEAAALRVKGVALGFLSRYDEARAAVQEAIRRFRALQDTAGEVLAQTSMGSIYQRQRQYEQAMSLQAGLLSEVRRLKLPTAEANLLGNMAENYLALNEPRRAMDVQGRALELREQAGDEYGLAVSLVGIGRAYQAEERYDRALEYFERALTYAREADAMAPAADALRHMGDVLRKMNQPAEGLSYLREAVSTYQEFGDPHALIETQVMLAKALLESGQVAEARPLAEEALAGAEGLGDNITLAHAHEAYARILERSGTLQEALDHHRRYANLRIQSLIAMSAHSSQVLETQAKGSGESDQLSELNESLTEAKHREQAVKARLYRLEEELGAAERLRRHLEGNLRDVPGYLLMFNRRAGTLGTTQTWTKPLAEDAALLAQISGAGTGTTAAMLTRETAFALNAAHAEQGNNVPGQLLAQLHQSLRQILGESEFLPENGLRISLGCFAAGQLQLGLAGISAWLIGPDGVEEIEGEPWGVGAARAEDTQTFRTVSLTMSSEQKLILTSTGAYTAAGGQRSEPLGKAGFQQLLAPLLDKRLSGLPSAFEDAYKEWVGINSVFEDVQVLFFRPS